eukprot:3690380-Pleurochrysis_carterae.AAC.1
MLAYAAVIAYFEFGSHTLRISESANPTRARHTPRVLLQSADLRPIYAIIARSVFAYVRLIGNACALALDADERCHDYVYAALFGLGLSNSKRAAPD